MIRTLFFSVLLLSIFLGSTTASMEDEVELVPESVWNRIVELMPKPEFDEDGEIRPHCPTDYMWEAWDEFYQQPGVTLKSGCEAETRCDVPNVRDRYNVLFELNKNKEEEEMASPIGNPVVIDVVVNVICFAENDCPSGVNKERVLGQLQTLNEDFETANVAWNLDEENLYFIVDPANAMLSAFSPLANWYNQLRTIKKLYAKDPNRYLNIFVTGQKSGIFGTLLGIGTFPWDPEALTEYGGLWCNAAYTGYGERTLSHEAGHNVGLWHSFHGVEEVGKCGSDCYEEPHPLDSEEANLVGDFCADTPAQPKNYDCKLPPGEACNGDAWNKYSDEGLLYNIMSYHMDDCMKFFTTQQAARSNCYLCNSVPSLLANSEICEDVEKL